MPVQRTSVNAAMVRHSIGAAGNNAERGRSLALNLRSIAPIWTLLNFAAKRAAAVLDLV